MHILTFIIFSCSLLIYLDCKMAHITKTVSSAGQRILWGHLLTVNFMYVCFRSTAHNSMLYHLNLNVMPIIVFWYSDVSLQVINRYIHLALQYIVGYCNIYCSIHLLPGYKYNCTLRLHKFCLSLCIFVMFSMPFS